MRRILSALLAELLLPAFCTGALAAPQIQIVRAFEDSGTLYTYVDMAGLEQPVTKAEATLDGQICQAAGRLETVRQAGSPVSYLLLVDASTSMPDFQADVLSFAEELVRHSGENTRFSLATFGDGLQISAEDVSPEELTKLLAGLEYVEPITQLHSAIDQALDHLEATPREGNELRSLVVLTDAVEYDPQGGVPYDDLLARIEQSDVMLHAVGFGDDEASLERLGRLVAASDGQEYLVGETLSPVQAADSLAEETGALYVVGFDLSGLSTAGGEETFSLVFSSGAELLGRSESSVLLPAAQSGEEIPGDRTPVPAPPASSGGTAPAGQPDQAEASGAPLSPLLVGGGAAALALILAAAFLLARRKKAPGPGSIPEPQSCPSPQAVSAPGGIFLRLEVLEGALTAGQTELILAGELLVGRDPSCGIAFDDGALAPRHSRIFLSPEGAVSLEDLAPGQATRVNGAPIQGTARLRSGDEIALGRTRFRLKF